MSLIPASQIRNRAKGTELIGDTLFVDGVPHTQCARCGIIRPKFDGVLTRTRDGRVVKEYKITFGKWKHEQDFTTDDSGYPIVITTSKLILWSKPGCQSCWQILEDRRRANGYGTIQGQSCAVYFDAGEVFRS